MDKKLLQALDNLSNSLEMIADSLQSGKASSDTGAALQSGDFVKQIQEINEGVKSIKVDTQQILKNQQTIIELSKKKESDKKTGEFEGASDPKKESAIKKGVATILLIAVAVLAIGMAFKLVGDINVLSVIGLALAITVVAIAFEKIAKLDLSIKQAAIASLTMVMMAFAVTASSWILGLITPVSFLKLLTATIIAAGFVLLGGSIAKMLKGFKGLSWGELIKAVVFLPLILPAIALGIALASYALQLVQPIGLSQFFSSILIAGIFAVVSYGIRNMIRAFDGISPKEAIVAALFLPIILPAISLAIALSSKVLGMVQPVGLLQWFTSILIGILFVVLSFGVAKIIKAFRGIDPATLLAASIGIPVILVAMSAAIWGSSELLSKVVPIGFFQFLTALGISAVFVVISYGIKAIAKSISSMKWSDVPKIPVFFVAISAAIMASSLLLQFTADLSDKKLFTIAALGATLAGIGFIMGATMKFVGKISLKDLLIGSLGLVIIAGAIMVSSLILSVGNYETYPTLSWIAGVALSLTTFGIAAWVLGASVFGPQALVFLAGLGAVIAVAGTIVAVAKVLSAGKYDNKGMLSWAVATALLYATFTPIIMMLGAMGLAGAILSFFGAEDPFETAKRYMIQIAETIVSVSKVLKKGTYEGGPTKAWAEGISIALGAFMPVYGMLMKNAILSIFGSGGVGPDDFTKAILTVSDGIITAAWKFSTANAAFLNPPPVEWAEGVGKAIGAFSPVYKVLSEQNGWFVDGPSVDDMKNAILTISQGIVDAAYFFAENTAPFNEGSYPSKNWGEGVGAALAAFSPVFEMLSGKSWYQSSDKVIKGMSSGIQTISSAIVSAGKIFNKAKDLDWNAGIPTPEWGTNVAGAIKAFDGVFTYMNEGSGWFTSGAEVASDLAYGVKVISGAIAHAGELFKGKDWKSYPDKKWATGVRDSVQAMIGLVTWVRNKYGGEDDSVAKAGTAMSGLRNKVLYQMVASANLLFNNKNAFDPTIAAKASSFTKTLSTVVHDFINLGMSVEKRLVTMVKKTTESEDFFGRKSSTTEMVKSEKDMGIVDRVVSAMATTAKLVYRNRRYFNLKIDPNFVKRLGKNIIDYTRLAEYLVEIKKKEGGWLSGLSDSFGFSNDPIMQISNGMIYMAKAYDKLATAVDKFGGALERVDMEKLNSLKSLETGKLEGNLNRIEKVAPSEKEGGFWSKLTSATSGLFSGPEVKSPTATIKGGGEEKRSLSNDMKQIIDLLSGINKSTSLVNDYLSTITEENLTPPPEL